MRGQPCEIAANNARFQSLLFVRRHRKTRPSPQPSPRRGEGVRLECRHAKADFARARHRAICRNMILSSARYYFWFYGYPMPAAESGARLQ